MVFRTKQNNVVEFMEIIAILHLFVPVVRIRIGGIVYLE